MTQEFPPFHGGAATVCVEMAAAATRQGWKVTVIAPGSRQGERMDASFPFAVLRHGLGGRRGWRCRRRVRQTLESQLRVLSGEGSMIHLADSAAVAAGMKCRALIDSTHPLCLTLHGSEIPLFSRWPHSRRTFRNLLERADRIHLLSSSNRSLLQQAFPGLGTPTFVTGGAPSLPRDLLDQAPAGPHSGKLSLLTVGRIHPRKGQEALACTLAGLPHEQQRHLRWRIAGPTVSASYRRRVEKIIGATDIETEFCGSLPQEALVEAYATADLFALTSIPLPRSIEGLGLVYLDAALAGLPILAHRTGGVEEVVMEGENGFLVEPGEDDLRLERLRALISDAKLRERFGQRGRDWAKGQSWDAVTQTAYGA